MVTFVHHLSVYILQVLQRLIDLGLRMKTLGMALAANEASSSGGGIAIAKDGKILAKMPLQVGG